MSSKMEIQKICKFCGKEFTARKTVTQHCGDECAKRAYKARMRAAKIEACEQETKAIKAKPIQELKAKDFLKVRDVALLMGCCKQTVYGLIHSGRLKAVNLNKKSTVVRRSDIDKLFS